MVKLLPNSQSFRLVGSCPSVKSLAPALALSLTLAAGAGSLQPAQASSSNGISEMTSAVTSLSGIKDAAIPIAVAVIVFGSGALILKRLIYS